LKFPVSALFVGLGLLVPVTLLADAERAGRVAGGAGASSFNPAEGQQTLEDVLGLDGVNVGGSPGGAVDMRVTRDLEGRFPCRDGARFTIGGVRFEVDACATTDQGELDLLHVAVCDALTRGASCDDAFTAPQNVPPAGEVTFQGAPLAARFEVSAACESGICRLRMVETSTDAFGDEDMRHQADERFQGDDGHPLHGISDLRGSDDFQTGESEGGILGDCFGEQTDHLFSEGEMPVSCLPGDPRTIHFFDPDDPEAACESEVVDIEECETEIPTQLVTCAPDAQTCEVERESAEITCGRSLMVEQDGVEACTPGEVVYQWTAIDGFLYRRFVCSSCSHPHNCLEYQFNQDGAGWRGSFIFEYSLDLPWHHPDLLPGAPDGYYIRQACGAGECTIYYRRYPDQPTTTYEYEEAAPIYNEYWVDDCEALEVRSPDAIDTEGD